MIRKLCSFAPFFFPHGSAPMDICFDDATSSGPAVRTPVELLNAGQGRQGGDRRKVAESSWYERRGGLKRVVITGVWLLFGLTLIADSGQRVWAQDANATPETPVDAPVATGGSSEESLNFFQLLLDGGFLMIPILFMSLLLVTFTIERLLGLRTNRVLPSGLVRDLGQLSGSHGSFDPRQAYRVCQQYPSAAANVVRAMLLKVGRPHSEVEHTVTEASEREAARLYANVRWLNLAAAVTPLMGLLGTVWGMIQAFHDTTQMMPGQNKADYLAEGIYIALVTTLAGLMVAIPAAIFSHYFEGRIQTLFIQIDELLFNLMPQIERYEGRVRFGRGSDGSGEGIVASGNGTSLPSSPATPITAPAATASQAARRVMPAAKPAGAGATGEDATPRMPASPPLPVTASPGPTAPPVATRKPS
jgi:biopolymer transport protein ExbB